MFRVSLGLLQEVADELHEHSVQINRCMEDVEQVRHVLKELSFLEEAALWKIRQIEDNLNAHSSKISQLSQALRNIQEQYYVVDRRVEDHFEKDLRTVRREAVSYFNLQWVDKFFKNIW